MNYSSDEERNGCFVEKHDECPQKNIIISIILSESTASLLKLEIPNVQDLISENSDSTIYSLHSTQNVEENPPPSTLNIKDYFFHNKQFVVKRENEHIQTEVAYFSNTFKGDSYTSVEAFDDLPDVEDDEYDIEEVTLEESLFLVASKIYVRPLVAANTTAHQDRLKSDNNSIYISVLDSELTITSSGWINFCRICHGGESIANLISPCRCKGSIALTHLQCLEEWLKQSSYSRCELCQHHYDVVREPKYSIPWSILVFLRHPGEHYKELLLDVLGFLIYTPTAIASTYLLMLLCDSIAAKTNLQHSRNISAHFMAFSAVFGMAAIDFTYSSWLVIMLQRHVDAWKLWYQSNCSLRVILPPRKQRRHIRKKAINDRSLD